jgi:hypothetical protein
LENQISRAQMSQSQHGPQVDASASQIAMLQHQSEVGGIGAQASGTRPSKSATIPEPAAIEVSELAAERDRAATDASELVVARRDVETKAALLSKATGEAAQIKQAAEATAAELRQSLVQERDRVAALARELATARRSLETEVALSRKAGEEAEQLRQAAKATPGGLEQERKSAAIVRDPEPLQRAIGTGSRIERPAGTRLEPMNAVAEQTAAKPPRTAVKNNSEGARLMARASALLAQGSIGAARMVLERAAETGSAQATFTLAETYDPRVLAAWKAYGTRGDAAKARDLYARASDAGIRGAEDQSHALVDRARKPATWFGRDETD